MSWTARLKTALSGEVAGVDVDAMLAATAPLDALHQALADRRLSARITHIGEEWLVFAEAASLAAPLWLADSLILLAQALHEAEADAHPDRPNAWSAAAHELAVAALLPLESLVAEASAAAADPGRPSRFTAAVMAGPRGEVAASPLSAPLSPGYVRGLLLAADRLHGAASQLLRDGEELLRADSTPAWLTAGFQRTNGDLAAASTRRAMLRARLDALLPDPTRFQPGVADAALAPLCLDGWGALNAALAAGQRLSDPRLLPGAPDVNAPRRRPSPAPSAAPRSDRGPVPSQQLPPASARAPASPPTAPRPAAVEQARELPDIQTFPGSPRRPPLAVPGPTAAEPPERALPAIGGAAAARLPAGQPARPLPSIGGHGRAEQEEDAAELPRIGPKPAS